MDALNCTYDDYQKAAGFSGLGNLVKARPRLGKFFKIENDGMRLPSVHRRILANPSLDKFVTGEFKKFADPNTRLFGENTFTITGVVNDYRIGHLERRRTYVMEYNGNFIVVRNLAGGERKWRVSHQ